ncbi:nucleic acid-binding protein [Auriculariales sp. MPI-PUGE-AT-0066]|nr:nucleic acid-binding protein [Auriculariales sp. MPI-PUGE-AT-0066]
MRVLAQITNVLPLCLVVSLPNQLLGHIPITHISKELNARLESATPSDEEHEDEDSESEAGPSSVPDLGEIFLPGQYLTAVVSKVHAAGTTVESMLKRPDVDRASQRVELSIIPEEVNDGIPKRDLGTGMILPAAIKSVEDHGYVLNFGVPDASGFLSFKDAKKGSHGLKPKRLPVGMTFQVAITKKSDNGRIFNVSIDPVTLKTSHVSELSTVTSVLPGLLVSGLVTAELPTGLNVQILGYFDASIDQHHLPSSQAARPKIGDKIKARVLWEVVAAQPRRFALSSLPHVLKLGLASVGSDTNYLRSAFPMGTVIDAVKVIRVETEFGLVCQIGDDTPAFVHISNVSDEHINNLSATAGNWKVGTVHRARVVGFSDLDGVVQLSLKQTILDQKFMSVSDVTVGERMKGTVKLLSDKSLFISVSGSVDAVVWPNHYADITLRHPEKRFKSGGTVKARVLIVDPSRNRLCLTLKKTLVESDLPVISSLEDAKPGTVTHAVVFKNLDKGLLVEFFNNLRAFVPQREINDNAIQSSDDFPIGRVVRVKVLEVDVGGSKILASIRQGAANFESALDISGVEDGAIVSGSVTALHSEHAVLSLKPSKVRALLAFANYAKHRNQPVAQAKASLTVGDSITGLTVVSRSTEKGLVFVGYNQPKKERSRRLSIGANSSLKIEDIKEGQLIPGLIVSHGRKGAVVRVSNKISGSLHPLDVADEYGPKLHLPAANSTLNFAVVSVDQKRKHLTLSTRPSRVTLDDTPIVVDKEIDGLDDVRVGQKVRGFIKNIADHGIFVSVGRNLDVRVQIKELFDEFVKDWKSKFDVDQCVEGRITAIDAEKHQVEMSLRSDSKAPAAARHVSSLADYAVGNKVDAMVKSVELYGIFLQIDGTNVSGLCHKSQISDNADADVQRAMQNLTQGDRVKAVVLSVELEKRRINFGLKPSYFSAEDFAPTRRQGDASDEDEGAGSDAEDTENADESGSEDSDSEVVELNSDNDVVMEEVSPQSGNRPAPSALQIGGFNWSSKPAEQDGFVGQQSDSDDSDPDGGHERKKKRKKHEIEHDLTADMHNRTPESTADFERLLLGSPNSSYIWVQYMSFQMQLSEIEKAREIGRRALKVINFREEQEKLNVWIALLNLENLHGNLESLEALFKDAARHNEAKTVYLRLAAIFEQTGKLEQAEEQYQKTCKKFGKSSKVWTLFAQFYLEHGRPEDGRKLLARCVQSLEKRKHLKTVSKFAQLEYNFGDPERGRTIFEGIVSSHPKRYDLWFIYLDMEAGQKNVGAWRNLFERVLTQKMSDHKAKAFFKKWLDIEKRVGDEEGQELVKSKAMEWAGKATVQE